MPTATLARQTRPCAALHTGPARLIGALPATLLATAALAASGLAPRTAQAQAPTAAPGVVQATAPTAPASADDLALLQAFGQQDGLKRLASDLVDRLRADTRVSAFFTKTKPAHFKQQISDQLCQILQGPCVYDGESMKNAHAGLDISKRDFLIMVDLLQQAMDAQGIPFAAQNRLLARLAPMHRDIITR